MHVSRSVLILAVACGLGLVAALPAAAEDLTVVSKVTLGKDRVSTTTQYVSSDRVRTGNGDNDTVVEYVTGRMVMIDNKKKEYYETSLAEMSAWLDQMSEQMKGSPIGGLFGGKGAEAVKVDKGTASRKIAGYDCDQYVLSMGDSMRFDVWAARGLDAPHQYYDAAKAPYAAMGPMGQKFQKMYEEMKKIKGYPLSVGINAKMMMIKMDTLSEATEVKKGPIAASAFEVPGGYKKKDSPFRQKK